MSRKKGKPIVAVVGRPNVGKSTLFNALAGEMISIVKDTPGITRDRIYVDVTWLDHSFTLIDTGGIEPDSKDVILSQMREQAQIAIDTADVILFMTDVRQGLVDADAKVADMLRRSHKPVVLVVNKTDDFQKFMPDVYEFYNLGIGEPLPISAANRLGIGDMLDIVISHFPTEAWEEQEDERSKIAIVGKPNVGKSTIMNLLSGRERSIVSSVAGTTRDIVEETVNLNGAVCLLSDCAGIRETDDEIEKIGVEIMLKRLENADIVLAVFDGSRALSDEDKRLIGLIEGKNVIPVINKNDLESELDADYLEKRLGKAAVISAKDKNAAEVIGNAITSRLNLDKFDGNAGFLANERQRSCVLKAEQHVAAALSAAALGVTPDAIGVELEAALDAVYELSGKRASDEVIAEVFKRFCVGK